jgi:hypothetical protein
MQSRDRHGNVANGGFGKNAIAFQLTLLLTNLIMGFVIGYSFRAATHKDPRT